MSRERKTLWDIHVEHWDKVNEEWVRICSFSSRRYLFDTLESAKVEAERIYGKLVWHRQDNEDEWASADDGRLLAEWVEGLPRGGREME